MSRAAVARAHRASREKLGRLGVTEAREKLQAIFDALYPDGLDSEWSPDTLDRVNQTLLEGLS